MVDRFLCADIPHIFWDFSKNAGECLFLGDLLVVFCRLSVSLMLAEPGISGSLLKAWTADIGEFVTFRRFLRNGWPMHSRPQAVGCFRSMPHAGLRVYASSFGGADYDSLLLLFCMRLYWFAALVCFVDGFACFVLWLMVSICLP